jgi:hypothetical protein
MASAELFDDLIVSSVMRSSWTQSIRAKSFMSICLVHCDICCAFAIYRTPLLSSYITVALFLWDS